jgi:hypothetical protein
MHLPGRIVAQEPLLMCGASFGSRSIQLKVLALSMRAGGLNVRSAYPASLASGVYLLLINSNISVTLPFQFPYYTLSFFVLGRATTHRPVRWQRRRRLGIDIRVPR